MPKRYFAGNKGTGQEGRGLKYTVLVQLLSSTTAPGESRLRPRVMEARLERVANGELLELWAERQATVQKAGAQPAAAAPAAPEPEPAAVEDDDQAALDGGHDVLVLISEVWGGFSPEAMRFLGELSQARNDGIDIERASATWSTSSFTSYHGQLLSLAVQWGVAIEIERAVKTSARFC